MEKNKTFGKYLLLRRLAIGGMAEIFLAQRIDEPDSPPIVIKRILSYRADDREFVQMFLEEAELSSLLEHPNIVKIFDWGETDGHYYMAMEYIDGLDLSQLLENSIAKGEKIPLYIVAGIISQAAEGLHFAHHYRHPQTGAPLNLVHRDISPPNIMVSRSGNVKLLDFGIAKAASSMSRRDPTKTGILKGKLAYMSPEYLRGDPIDGRHDLFALGVVMYELATGEKPFAGKRDVQILQAILMQPPKNPREFVPDLPEKFVSILMKMLEKEPPDRFQTGLEVKEALQEFLFENGYLEITPHTISDYIGPFLPIGESDSEQPIYFNKTPTPQKKREEASPYFNPQEISNPNFYIPQQPNNKKEQQKAQLQKTPPPNNPPFMETTPPFGFQSDNGPNWHSEETKAISLEQVKLEHQLNPQSEETAVINLENIRDKGISLSDLQLPPTGTELGDLPTSEVGTFPQKNGENKNDSENTKEEPIPPPSQYLQELPQEPKEEESPPKKEKKFSIKIAMIALLSILVVAGGGFLGWLHFYRGKTPSHEIKEDPQIKVHTNKKIEKITPPQKIQNKVKSYKKEKKLLKNNRKKVVKNSKKFLRKNLKNRDNPSKNLSQDKSDDLPPAINDRKTKNNAGFQGIYLTTRPSCFVFWKKKNLGQTPGFFALPSGRHKLYLRKKRPYILYPITINIPKNRKLRKFISIPEAYLTVRTSHPAKLIIDGYTYGTINTHRTIRLYAGYHKISVRAISGFFRRSSYTDWIFLNPRQRKNLSFTFF